MERLAFRRPAANRSVLGVGLLSNDRLAFRRPAANRSSRRRHRPRREISIQKTGRKPQREIARLVRQEGFEISIQKTGRKPQRRRDY